MTGQTEETPKEEGLLRSLDNYWFGHGSPTTLGIFRILMGTLAVINFLMLAPHWSSWFSERGFVPAWLGQMFISPAVKIGTWAGAPAIPRIGLIGGITDPRITIPFFCLGALAAITTALGLWTRLSTFVLAVVLVSIHHRNGIILHGGDTVLRVCCLYLAISPCGLACSLDRLIGLWKGKIAPIPVSISLWPQRLIAYNVALIYFTTVWLKMDGNLWRTGWATWFPSRLAEFYRFPVPGFLNQPPFVQITTYGTLLIEFALATIVFFRPCRKYVLIAGLLMHAGIEYSMNIPLFSYLITSMYIAFYEGDEISRWAERMGHRLRRFQVTVRFPNGKQLRPEAAAFLDAADPFKLITYASSAGVSWDASRYDGRPASHVKMSRSRSLGAWVFSWWPGLWKRILTAALENAPALEAHDVPPQVPRKPRTKR